MPTTIQIQTPGAPEGEMTTLYMGLDGNWYPSDTQFVSQEASNNPDIAGMDMMPSDQQALWDLKQNNPSQYYQTLISDWAGNMGFGAGSRGTNNQAKLQEVLNRITPEAKAAGLTDEQINNLAGTRYANAQNLAASNVASSGGDVNFGTVAPAMAGIVGMALLPELAPLFSDSLNSGLTTTDILSSSGFTPTAGSSFAIDPTAAYTTGFTNAASGFGLNAGAPTVGAYSPSGAAATQSSLGLGYNPVGLETSSVGMGGTTGAGSLSGITGTEAAAGLGGANLGTGLTAEQLARYESAAPSSSNLSNASKLAKALTSGMGSQLSNAAQNFATGQTGVGSAIPAIIRGNQNPFVMTQNLPIQNTTPDLSSLANLLKQG